MEKIMIMTTNKMTVTKMIYMSVIPTLYIALMSSLFYIFNSSGEEHKDFIMYTILFAGAFTFNYSLQDYLKLFFDGLNKKVLFFMLFCNVLGPALGKVAQYGLGEYSVLLLTLSIALFAFLFTIYFVLNYNKGKP